MGNQFRDEIENEKRQHLNQFSPVHMNAKVLQDRRDKELSNKSEAVSSAIRFERRFLKPSSESENINIAESSRVESKARRGLHKSDTL